MNTNYCKSKSKKLIDEIKKVESEIKKYEDCLEKLTQHHIFLQGSLAVVNELLELEGQNETCPVKNIEANTTIEDSK